MTAPVASLLPCPFCGGEMMFRKALWPSDGNIDSIIHAGPASCGMVVFEDGTTDESIIASWNRRASPAPSVRDREADRRQFPDADFNAWLDTGISDCGHTVWSALGDVQAAWQGWGARQFAGDAVLLAECCGREECGGECGNEWRGTEWVRKATPAEQVDANFLRHVASVCRGAVDLCEPKPQRTPEDDREYNGGLCLSELANIADEIDRRLATTAGSAQGEAVAWRIHWSPQFPDGFELTSNRKRVDDCRALDNAPRIEPLYTTPPPAPAAEQPEGKGDWKLVPVELTDEKLSLALSHVYGDPFWRKDARPIGEFLSGCTATESELHNIQAYGPQRMKAAYAAMIADAPAAPEPVLTDVERATIEALLNLGYAAWCLADNTEDSGGEGLTIERSDFAGLETHLNTLAKLPDDQPGYTMGEAAKARWALRRLLAAAAS